MVKNNEDDLKTTVEKTMQHKLSELEQSFEALKNDFNKKLDDFNHKSDLLNLPRPSTYADIAGNRSSVLIRPRVPLEEGISAKSEVFSKINPVGSTIIVNQVRPRKDGGIIVGCKNSDDVRKLCDLAQDKLADKYEIKEVNAPKPKIKIVGVNEDLPEEELIQCLKIQNEPCFTADSECKILKYWHTKKNNKIFQVIVELDVVTYGRLSDKLSNNKNFKLLIGYDACMIYDAVEPFRCFNCSGYNHTSQNCTAKAACPICSQEHNVKECQSSTVKCVNCCNLPSGSSGIDVGHAAWDKNCPIYKNKLSGFKALILGRQ